jgi:hypothetical protein
VVEVGNVDVGTSVDKTVGEVAGDSVVDVDTVVGETAGDAVGARESVVGVDEHVASHPIRTAT